MRDRPRTFRLWQEITLALALKIVLLGLIWLAWFSTPGDHAIDASKMTSHLFPQQHP